MLSVQGQPSVDDSLEQTTKISYIGIISSAYLSGTMSVAGLGMGWLSCQVILNGQVVTTVNLNNSFGTTGTGEFSNIDVKSILVNGNNDLKLAFIKGSGIIFNMTASVNLTYTGVEITTGVTNTTPASSFQSFIAELTGTGKWLEYILILVIIIIVLYFLLKADVPQAVGTVLPK